MPILFACALFIEAKPLIKHFNLKKQQNLKNFQLFSNNDTYLVITGTGKTASAVGTTLALSKLNQTDVQVINLGICGSLKEKTGKMFLINKINDNDTNRDFYPDNLIKTSLPQKSLITVGKVLNRESGSRFWTSQKNSTQTPLIDMEGSSFFEAASFFIPVNQIYLLKIVSDNLNQKKLEKDLVTEIIEKNLNDVELFVNNLKKQKLGEKDFFIQNETIINKLFEKSYFTATQQSQIKKYLRDICLNQEISLDKFLLNLEECLINKKTPLEKGKAASKFIQEYYRGIF